MALADFFSKAKEKTAGLFNHFFYDDTAPQDAPEDQEEARQPQTQYAQQPPYAPSPAYQQQAYAQQNAYQQAYAQQNAYQQPQNPYQQQAYQQQPAYQQPQAAYAAQSAYQQQNVYQQPQAAQQQAQPQMYSQFAAQLPPQTRNRRMQQHTQQREENVVPFPGAYQQPDAQQQAQQQAQAQGGESVLNARVINVRGINDCRSAISLLRAGDALVVVMDSVSDPAEMRRYVDTLSGACFSLSATITKVSRYGAYLVAPSCVNVYADQVTSQMNGAPHMQTPRYAPSYQPYGQQAAYAQQPSSAQQGAYVPQMAQDQQGFERRAPAPDVSQNAFYAQRPQNAPAAPAFEAQPAGYGYAPDRTEAAE